jgi:hypothetical protein
MRGKAPKTKKELVMMKAITEKHFMKMANDLFIKVFVGKMIQSKEEVKQMIQSVLDFLVDGTATKEKKDDTLIISVAYATTYVKSHCYLFNIHVTNERIMVKVQKRTNGLITVYNYGLDYVKTL